jgi:arylsulfatase A-like enzyme
VVKFYLHLPLRGVPATLIFLALATMVFSACSNKDENASTQQLPVPNETARPNIVLLLFDDAGYSDMSAFGGEIQTPNIERIVKEGVTVKRFYTTARCSPTRAGILSGHHPHDVGMADLAGPLYKTDLSAYQGLLSLEVPLVSELLQAAGYRTYMQGKWHLGAVPVSESDPGSISAPNLRGFDHFFGFLGGMAAPYPNPLRHPYKHNQKAIEFEKGWYAVAGLNAETMKQLSLQFETDSETPFFLYIASQSPHDPLQAPQALVDKYRKIYDRPLEDLWHDRVSRMRDMGLFPVEAPIQIPLFTSKDEARIRSAAAIRAAMIETSDTELGSLVQLLEENGELDNTLIIVASDNGASSTTSELTNAPFLGAKGVLYEGGTLSPLVARWPGGKIKVNAVTDEMTTYLDLMPTFLQVAGISYPAGWHGETHLRPLEGRNLLPLFQGEKLSPPENFYWNLDGHIALLHKGRWKLLVKYNEEKERNNAEATLELYDLKLDPAETTNLAGQQKEMASMLLDSYRRWADEHGAVPYYQVLDAYKPLRAARNQALKARLDSIPPEKKTLPLN